MPEKKFRVQLDFREPDFKELNDLVDELGLSTRAELIRSGIIALRWMMQKRKQGYPIVAITEDRYIVPEFDFLRKIPDPPLPRRTR